MKIKFVPTNIEIENDPNKTLLQLCNENKIEIKSVCKGVPSCAECRIRIVSGEHNILPPSKSEMSLIGTNYFIDQRRLSCQVRCFGEVTVDLSEQIERAETQSKKIRGFRSQAQKGNHVESKAKQGTLVLEEGPEILAAPTQQPQQQQKPRHPQQNRPRQGGPQQQQGQQKQNRPNNQNRQQQQGQGRSRPPQGPKDPPKK